MINTSSKDLTTEVGTGNKAGATTRPNSKEAAFLP